MVMKRKSTTIILMMMMTTDNYDKIIPCTDTDPLRRNASIMEAVSRKSCSALAASLGVVDKSLNIFRATASRSVLMTMTLTSKLLMIRTIMMIMMILMMIINIMIW